MQNSSSYGLDKNLTIKYDLDLRAKLTNVSNGTSTCDGEQLCQFFYNPSTIVEVMVWTHSDGRTEESTYTKLSLSQLCLAHHKWARQTYLGSGVKLRAR